mmetsp:Transcript_16089/g.30395  ORF Transcript_16089/g.30395 Transcript_16089/m.30395 type:complete len:478 (-) Transcript_16089:66-1499(-)
MEEEQAKRVARKLEAKKLKHERIVEAGGKRPRPEKTDNGVTVTTTYTAPPKNRKKKKIEPKKSHDQHHRFGRVMDHAPCPNQSRFSTLSIAIPGSIVSNAQTQELRTHLVGQIARAAAIYHVDEIVVFNDGLGKEIKPNFRSHYRNRGKEKDHRDEDRDENGGGNGADKKIMDKPEEGRREQDEMNGLVPSTDPHAFMARILQYCECPQYLRRHFFPMHPDLQFAGLLAPLDAPHHVRALDRCEYREGVVTEKRASGEEGGSLVNCGIRNQLVEIDRVLSPGIRCTVYIEPRAYTKPGKSLKGKVVSPSEPREKDGTYWGYQTRMASSIKAIFDEAPFQGGYDLKIGTSERGDVCVDDESFGKKHASQLSSFQHAIIVLGGVAGIEECVDADERLGLSGNDSKKLFDLWVNICQYQGSRTIRTEEALMISLAKLRPLMFSKHGPVDQKKSVRTENNLPPAIDFSDEEPSDESSCSEE